MSDKYRAMLFKSNIDLRSKRFSSEIAESVANSRRYTLTDIRRNSVDLSSCGEREYPTFVSVTDQSIVYHLMVLIEHMSGMNGKTAILNPGDYINPGGGYLAGNLEYEEELCSITTLFEVLSKCDDYYGWNKNHVNNGLYTNVCLYTPDIIICNSRNNRIGTIDVITCSAPNYDAVPVKKANKAVHDRIELVFNVAVRNGVQNLILTGFGCGYNRSDIEFILETFREMYTIYSSRFNTVTFVMGDSCIHFERFDKMFPSVV